MLQELSYFIQNIMGLCGTKELEIEGVETENTYYFPSLQWKDNNQAYTWSCTVSLHIQNSEVEDSEGNIDNVKEKFDDITDRQNTKVIKEAIKSFNSKDWKYEETIHQNFFVKIKIQSGKISSTNNVSTILRFKQPASNIWMQAINKARVQCKDQLRKLISRYGSPKIVSPYFISFNRESI